MPTQFSVLSSTAKQATQHQKPPTKNSTGALVLNAIILRIAVMSLNKKPRLQLVKQKDSETHLTLVCLGLTVVGTMQSPLIDCIQPDGDGYISKYSNVYINVMVCKKSQLKRIQAFH